MSAVEYADAVLSALATAGVSVYEENTAPEAPEPPHAVVYTDLGRAETYRLSGRSKVTARRVAVLVVAGTPNNTRVVAGDVIGALKDQRVNGSLVHLESSTNVRRDDSDPPGTYVATLVFTFASVPTA